MHQILGLVVEDSKPVQIKITQKLKKYQKIITAFVVIAALVISAIILWPGRTTPVTEVVTYSTDQPSEQKPDDGFNWRGGPNDPKKIRITSLGIDAYVQNVGVDQNNEIAVPNNIHVAGWFIDSVRPGDKGLSIIDGHLNGRQRDGIFANLETIQKGAVIFVEFGDGTAKQFKVTDKVTVDTEEAASVLFSQYPSVTHQLNLVTCGGNFDRDAHLYTKRVIVSSVRVDT